MAEFILRILGALIEAFFDGILESTGRRVLSWWGLKSNAFVETLVGALFLALISIVLGALVVALFAR